MPSWEGFKRSIGLGQPVRHGGGAPSGYSTQYEGVAPGSSSAFNLPGYDQFQQGLGQFQGGLDQFAQDRGGGPFRGQQQTLADMLMRQAQGQDSLSAEQMRQQQSRAQAMQQSMAAGASPSRAAMAARLASQGMANASGQIAGQGLMAGIAERQAAAQSLGGVLQGARGQDLEAYLGAQQIGLGSRGLGLQGMQSQQQAQLAREQLRAGYYNTAMGVPSKGEALVGALTGGAKAWGALP